MLRPSTMPAASLLVSREALLLDQFKIALPAHEIKAKPINRQCRQRRVGVANMPVSGMDEQLRRAF